MGPCVNASCAKRTSGGSAWQTLIGQDGRFLCCSGGVAAARKVDRLPTVVKSQMEDGA